ncbi:protein serine/threonine phosphatase 2C [Dichomitus squalens]|uniref:Protein serine/threonine phosphatase 2C n=1 Tax=Dichomitus squalens TaxID=114155 RepID=A0A4Q9P4P0_9APHY|nr:protein serine/threonine phosphatase 2C [Dichomitus squalens]TBU59663.1 protein serine/threonine phosphatase 2C [Dichomitus squalens]
MASAAGSCEVSDDAALPPRLSFKCAVTDSKGPRRSMEDAHSIVVPFGGVRGQGFFAIFDGHAGKQAAQWCGQNFALCLLHALRRDRSATIPDVLNQTFHNVDMNLSRLSEESDGKMHSGCTVVTAFLRLEDENGSQAFLPPDFDLVAPPLPASAADPTALVDHDRDEIPDDATNSHPNDNVHGPSSSDKDSKSKGTTSKLLHAIKSLGGVAHHRRSTSSTSAPGHPDSPNSPSPVQEKIVMPPDNVRRVLYCANAGDARGVLCRAGKAVRLTYDHKGSDKQEAKRITDAGGFVMSGRVNGVLNVTRSLGDSSMKEFVVGSPYTTETELSEQDEFLILACDGLWDVVNDQGAVNLVRAIADPRQAAEELLDHAYKNYSTDNVTVLVVRFRDPPESVRAD